MLKPSAEINNCYLLQKKLGEDFCAEHWLALAVFSPNRFLLRFIKDQSGCRELQEAVRAEAIAAYPLEAEALVPLIEVDYYGGRLFISTEFRDEVPLAAWLKNPPSGEPLVFGAAVARLAAGLEQYHARGKAFAGVFPHNIQVARQGRLESDFRILGPGNAALIDALRASFPANRADAAYLAPELRQSGAPTAAGDVYSLGVLLTALLAAGAAAGDFTAEGLARAGIPDAFVPVILKATAPDPQRRYASGAALEAELRGILRRMVPAEPAAAPAPVTGGARERPALPVSEVRPEVLNYFQEISADYRSAQGLGSPGGTTAPTRPAPSRPSPKPAVAAPTVLNVPAEEVADLVPLEEMPTPEPRSAEPRAPLPAVVLSGASANDAALPVRWQYRQVPLESVVAALEKAVQRARRGQGDFRYIGEPADQAGRSLLSRGLERAAEKTLLVEVGPLAPEEATTVNGFLRAFSAALVGPLTRETPRSRQRFARLLRQKEVAAYFETPAPDAPTEAADRNKIIDGLTVFGRKNKPLVVLVRGSERIGGDLSAFLQLIAPLIRRKPVCFFILGQEFPTPLRGYKQSRSLSDS